MIKNKDRSYWFGASDTKYIMGNWNTDTFIKWWLVKIGLLKIDFSNKYTVTGTIKEHQILDFISKKNKVKISKDNQVKIKKHRLRVNFDGLISNIPLEVKTYKIANGMSVKKEYKQQLQVEMWVKKSSKGIIAMYGLLEEDYDNMFLPIDDSRLDLIEYELDVDFIKQYLSRIVYLKKCMKDGIIPDFKECEEIYGIKFGI